VVPVEGVVGAPAGREAAFFDLDKTIIARAAMAAFRSPLYDGGLLSRRSLARVLFGQLVYLHLGASDQRLARMRESVLRLTAGWDQRRVRAIVEEALEEVVEPIIYAEALDLIDEHRAAGRLVVIVSASPEEIVDPLGRHLGADLTIASRAAIDDEGRYTGSMSFYAYGPYKADAMRAVAMEHGVDLARSFAYTDSYTDLPMLEAVGHPVVVNADRVLQRLARDRGWQVRQFVRPVTLRDRVRDRVRASTERPAVAFSAGALATGAAALALGWWLGSRYGPSRQATARALGETGLAAAALGGPPRPGPSVPAGVRAA
jgi:HAD superfamily hydrolase (TIGR01490 family)